MSVKFAENSGDKGLLHSQDPSIIPWETHKNVRKHSMSHGVKESDKQYLDVPSAQICTKS